jgi:hypothetical protein
MTNAQKYANFAEQEIAVFQSKNKLNKKRHEEAVEAGEVEERYFENSFYFDETANHLMLAKIYAQLACAPEPIILGDVPFEEAAQEPAASTVVDPTALLADITRLLPGFIDLIQSTSRPSGRPPFRG